MSIGLYHDDDTGIPSLGIQAGRRSLLVVRSDDVGMRGSSDIEHLRYAASRGLTLVTCNRRDFLALHWTWIESGERHAGIIIVNQDMPKGERIRVLLALCQIASPEDFANRLEHLKDWS